ncbi:hypothetical protein FB451DRAFT_1193071 [Mycena latifolia]|nr:hypothetical protein FB451DRAFT_1193071 [Mycena latifolia]
MRKEELGNPAATSIECVGLDGEEAERRGAELHGRECSRSLGFRTFNDLLASIFTSTPNAPGKERVGETLNLKPNFNEIYLGVRGVNPGVRVESARIRTTVRAGSTWYMATGFSRCETVQLISHRLRHLPGPSSNGLPEVSHYGYENMKYKHAFADVTHIRAHSAYNQGPKRDAHSANIAHRFPPNIRRGTSTGNQHRRRNAEHSKHRTRKARVELGADVAPETARTSGVHPQVKEGARQRQRPRVRHPPSAHCAQTTRLFTLPAQYLCGGAKEGVRHAPARHRTTPLGNGARKGQQPTANPASPEAPSTDVTRGRDEAHRCHQAVARNALQTNPKENARKSDQKVRPPGRWTAPPADRHGPNPVSVSNGEDADAGMYVRTDAVAVDLERRRAKRKRRGAFNTRKVRASYVLKLCLGDTAAAGTYARLNFGFVRLCGSNCTHRTSAARCVCAFGGEQALVIVLRSRLRLGVAQHFLVCFYCVGSSHRKAGEASELLEDGPSDQSDGLFWRMFDATTGGGHGDKGSSEVLQGQKLAMKHTEGLRKDLLYPDPDIHPRKCEGAGVQTLPHSIRVAGCQARAPSHIWLKYPTTIESRAYISPGYYNRDFLNRSGQSLEGYDSDASS